MFEFHLNVRGYELDSNGHANHAVYLNYFEQARWEMFRQTGLMDDLKKYKISPVVIDLQVRYSREVVMFDELVIRTEVTKKAPYLVFRQKMYFKDTSRKACSAVIKIIFTGEGRLVRDIPEEIIQKLT
ncbi:MAG: acyl-CoA thioesterase [Bacteroidales bacterium]|nr:acyl-CoA thioesterase [Bacteroidales bacterium]